MNARHFSPPMPDLGSIIPDKLKDLPIWLLWKAQPNGKLKPKKVAYWASGKIRRGKQGGDEDIANLVSFDRAWGVYNAAPDRYAGVGVALLTGMNVGALDLDDCIKADGSLIEDLSVRRIIKAVSASGCYIEKSPSASGLRVFGSTEGFPQIAASGLEAYSQGRFMTVTGDVVKNSNAWESIDGGVRVMQALIQKTKDDKVGLPPVQAKAHLQGKARIELGKSYDALPESPENVERVRKALASIDPDILYPDWVGLLMAIKSTEWECAEALACEWSEVGEKFTDAGFVKAWSSIGAAGGITLGTLFAKAKEAGWEDPRGLNLSAMLVEGQELELVAPKEERDLLNGRIFARLYRGRMLRVDQTGDVLSFDPETGWRKAGEGENATRKAARETLAHMTEQAARLVTAGDVEKSQRVIKHIAASSMIMRLDAMAAVAWTHDGMTTSASKLDDDENLLGVLNGVVELGKRSLRAFGPDDLTTKRAGVKFDPNAAAPQFEAFLERVQPRDDVRRLLQQIAGLTLWGKPGEQRLFFFHGGGANGKTTFVDALTSMLGTYAVSVPAEALMRQERSSQGPSPDTLRLLGARGAFTSEVREGRLDEERVKLWTGGDMLSARPPHGRTYIDFAPSHTFVMTGNHRPAIHDASVGIWRRVTLIDWGIRIPQHEQDARLSERLRREGSGILNWALEGLRDYWKNGLVVPPSIQAATEQYRSDEDIIGQFISERCRVGPDLKCLTGNLFASYRNWSEGNGTRAATKHTFTRRLGDRGHRTVNSGREYSGIAEA